MRILTLVAAGLSACSFSLQPAPANLDDAAVLHDTPLDQAPPTPLVRFTSIAPSVQQIRPGHYGFQITAVLRNELPTEITDIGATLTFATGTADRSKQFRWRDADRRDGVTAPQPIRIPPGSEATFVFTVDALASAAPPGPVEINGAAGFTAGGVAQSATALPSAALLEFEPLAAPIVVTTATDETAESTTLSLREAINLANATAGRDRIVFDLAAFPALTTTRINLVTGLNGLPDVTQDLVIDGDGRVALSLGMAWENPAGRWGLRLGGGTLVLAGLTFRNFAFNYQNENITDPASNCGGNNQLEGGAIRVNGGTLILDGNYFTDANVAERNCRASSVRIEGGTAHRIVHNTWTDQVMDALFINASVFEISDNLMNAGSTLNRVDECIYINTQGNTDLWIIGNVCVDQEYNAISANGGDGGALRVMHNTFVRNGRVGLGAIKRASTSRVLELRNNVYVSNMPSALFEMSGTNINAGFETLSSNTLCNPTCPNTTVASIVTTPDVQFTTPSGSTFADFLPRAGSPLVDTGVDQLDRNGSQPRRFNGANPDRGAVESP